MSSLRSLLVVCLFGSLSSATPATTRLAPTTPEEQSIWTRVAEEQAILDQSGFVLSEPEVETYLRNVLHALARGGGFEPEDFGIRILRNPTLNAFAYPNGHIYIHSGLLARILNEAQLAAILGHELTHATLRHAWKSQRSLKTKTGLLAVVAIGAPAAGDFSSLVQLLGNFGTMAAVSGYSRTLETESDEAGWHLMRSCGYDTSEAPEVFRMLMADVSENKRKEPFFFGTHPRLLDRERNFETLNKTIKGSAGSDKGVERFAAAIRPILLINGELEMRAGRHTAARDQLWRFRADEPTNVRVRWLIAENERIAGPAGDLGEARKQLTEALAMDALFAPAHRSLGLILFRAGELATAATHFQKFLDLDPNAHDRAYIEAYLDTCTKASVADQPSS